MYINRIVDVSVCMCVSYLHTRTRSRTKIKAQLALIRKSTIPTGMLPAVLLDQNTHQQNSLQPNTKLHLTVYIVTFPVTASPKQTIDTYLRHNK